MTWRFWQVFGKSLREHLREPVILALVLIIAPAFVFVYWSWFTGGSTAYTVLVLNHDRGAVRADGTALRAGDDLAEALAAVTYPSGSPILAVKPALDRPTAEAALADREAAMLIIIPEEFSQALAVAGDQAATGGTGEPIGARPAVTFSGDLGSAGYAVAAVIASGVIDQYVEVATGRTRPVALVEEPLGASGVRTEFETYVPGILIIAVIMTLFTTAMAVAREVETGTLRRLRLSRMTAFDLMAGISLTQLLVGVAAVILTFATAYALGFRSQGPIWVAVAVGAMTTLSVVGVGLIVAAFSKGVTEAFVIGNFPMMFFLFFSGAVFPMPRVDLFTVAGHAFGPYDIIPATHGVVALNKVLALGAGLGDVAFELVALSVLSVAYFAAGVLLFGRRHLRRA